MHVFDDEWVVIDSLKDQQRLPAALGYLTEMGVSPDRIRTILTTHWHDDHVAGIADLYEAATNAELALPLVMTTPEFAAFADDAAGRAVGKVTSGVAEMVALSVIRRGQSRSAPKRVQAATTLLRKKGPGGVEATLTALSPSAADVDDFLARVSTPHTAGPLVQRVMPVNPNDISVAASLMVGGDSVLLGADLELRGAADRGWRAVLGSTVWPRTHASLFKVPHHGSENAHCDEVWSELLLPDALAMLAPYNRGRGIPKGSDVQRIMSLAPQSYSTTQSPFRRYKGQNSLIEKDLQAGNLKVNSLPGEVGVVRMRRRPGEDWRVSTYRGATHLRGFVARS